MTTAERLEQKGRREAKLEIARNLLAEDIPLEKILKSTGLTRDDLVEAGIIEK